jgi:APA family basic amino acid/polyamine antiporter
VNIVTVSKLVALVALFAAAILVPGAEMSGQPTPTAVTAGPWSTLSLLLTALIPVMYVYSGWQKLSYVAEEVLQPSRNLPRAILLGVTLVVALYLVANFAYLRVLGASGLAGTETPAADVAIRLWGPTGGRFIGAVVIASIFGSLNLALMTTPRVYYALARDGLLFGAVARVSDRFRVPTAAILLQGIVGAALAASGSFARLVQYKVFGEWVFLMLSGVALLRLRRRLPRADRPMPVPLFPWTPLLFAFAAAGIVLNALLTDTVHALEGLAVIACGIPAYGWVTWRARAA